MTTLEVGEHKRALATHFPGVARHHFERRPHQRREVDLVDHEQIGAGDARAALARNLVTSGHIDDVNREVGQLRRKRRREIITSRLDKNDLQPRKTPVQPVDGLKIDRGILTDRGMRTAAGLDPEYALRREGFVAGEEFGILCGVNIVGHHRKLVALAQGPAQGQGQRRFAGTHRPADPHAQSLFQRGERGGKCIHGQTDSS
ncbi:hypothetical protein FACS189497_07150 [Betaproteobacteria bacterium]|nr:hypothetical protein FACS189497_07150 [Betaproteobacteria bacterium]